MNNKLKFGLLLLVVAALVLVPLGSAFPSYATSTGASCGTCHVNPNGGGTLTPAGTTFKNTGKLPVATPPPPPVVTTPTPPSSPPSAPSVGDDDEHNEHDNGHGGSDADDHDD